MHSTHLAVAVQVLHQSRLKAGPAEEPSAAAFLDKLRREKQLYYAPFGSNDDWYWLYAAVQAGMAPCQHLNLRQTACQSSAWTLPCSAMGKDCKGRQCCRRVHLVLSCPCHFYRGCLCTHGCHM